MKKLSFLLLAIAASSACSAYNWMQWLPQNNSQGYFQEGGMRRFGTETVDSISNNGLLWLDGTTVKGSVTNNGAINAQNAKIGSLNANGQVTLDSSTIQGRVQINGFLTAQNCVFEKEISIATDRLILRHSIVDSITVRGTDEWRVQVIELMDGTKVKGPIVFEAGNGVVRISSGSSYAGPVKGFTVVNDS